MVSLERGRSKRRKKQRFYREHWRAAEAFRRRKQEVNK